MKTCRDYTCSHRNEKDAKFCSACGRPFRGNWRVPQLGNAQMLIFFVFGIGMGIWGLIQLLIGLSSK